MSVVRGFLRGIGGLVALGVGLVILIPVALLVAAVGIPVLIVLAVAGVVGAGALLSVGVPMILAIALGIIGLAVVIGLLGGAIGLGIFLLKVMLFGLLLLWLGRKLFGGQSSRAIEPRLVGLPVADVAAPGGHRRDKYDIAAERELDDELGI